MPGPPRNGSVKGIRARNDPDLLYYACSLPFFPSSNFRGLAEHDRHKSCMYYFATGVGTYTNTAGAAVGKKQQDHPEVLTAPTAKGISQVIFDWCKRTHNHPLWPGTVTPRQTQEEWDAMTLFDFISYVAPPKEVAKPGPKRTRTPKVAAPATPKVAAPKVAAPATPKVAAPAREREVPVVEIMCRRQATRPASDNLYMPKVRYGPAPAGQFAESQALVRAAVQAPAPRPQKPCIWLALSDGQIFTDATVCQKAYNEAPAGVKLRLFHSLDEATAWLGEGDTT